MKRMLSTLLFLGAALSVQADDLLIRDATLHTMGKAGVLDSIDILISDGRITRIGADLEARGVDTVIDADGSPVTPAFFAGVTAAGIAEVGAVRPSVDDRLRDLFTGLMHPEFDVRTAYNPNTSVVPVTRYEGFGFGLLGASFGDRSINGSGGLVRYDGGYRSFEGKRVVFLNVTGGSAERLGGSRAAHWMLLNAAFAELEADADDLTLLTPLGQRSLADAVKNAVFVFTAHRASDILQVLDFSARKKLSAVIAGGRQAWMVRDELAAAKVPVIVNSLDNLPADFDSLGARMDNATLLHEAGVPVMFTASEAHNARKTRQIAGVAVANGLPHEVALAALSTVPGDVFGAGSRRLEPGSAADLVIWSGDPLEVTSWADQVILGGKVVPMETRQTKLRDRYLPLQAPMGRGYIKP